MPGGERRNPDMSSGPASSAGTTTRGYTGHEMLDDHGLIHMNGRVYDPNIGRFLSADIVVQSPSNSQSYNRGEIHDEFIDQAPPPGDVFGSSTEGTSGSNSRLIYNRGAIQTQPGDGKGYAGSYKVECNRVCQNIALAEVTGNIAYIQMTLA
ncbi:RHS repeat-associated core domain-containing protein [Gayadomonas joobiniege]|uniref:RHS repeat-associated core domain-containing protein n=1 Tax=Gayadomonas joobiniege TaxID=1234606 RepID=UPI00036C1F8B|nr:RHS repeat-associated core domain-containing protein [Gayadomonas joobiniege]